MATALYAALCGPILMYLSIRVIQARRSARVPIGGGTPDIDRARAVQSNFLDYVPLTLILMALAELQELPVVLVHAAGVLLVVSRAVHAYGVSQRDENYRLRILGMQATFFTLIYCSVLNLYAAGAGLL